MPDAPSLDFDGRARVVISRVTPQIDGGRYAVKRVLGDVLVIEADLLIDGHTTLGGVARVRSDVTAPFRELPLAPLGNDRFRAEVPLDQLGRWQFTVEGWVDAFSTWRWAFQRKVEAGQDIPVEIISGMDLVAAAVERAPDSPLPTLFAELSRDELSMAARAAKLLEPQLAAAMAAAPDRRHATSYDQTLEVFVEPVRARFSSWYELFPRSTGPGGKHGTFKDVLKRLPYVAELGFDVLYFPPIHPIGSTSRKGKNNSLAFEKDDPGSPWAIGNKEGGHKAIHPELGTAEDFRALVREANRLGIDIALDIAFQSSPDHPYVKEHPDWFIHRSDGSIQTAENPPKKYQDVYPLNFDGPDWQGLWRELKSVFEHWIDQGVRIFRVDNPHTKPLPFWAWCLDELKREHPDVIFLAEAFTRPALLQGLAKAGFSQSYTYFTWRNSKSELTHYLRSLVDTELIEYLRPNFWPATPDIFPEILQIGGKPAFISRVVLAGTLSSSYGIFGPSYELLEREPRPDSEELIHNEKYQLRSWDLEHPDSIRHVIARLNKIRKEEKALQDNKTLRFHPTDNEQVLCYSKTSPDERDVIVVVVNLDPHYTQAAWLDLELDWSQVGAGAPARQGQSYQVHDLLGGARYLWSGSRNYVQLDPKVMPAHIFRIRRLARREQQFEYYL